MRLFNLFEELAKGRRRFHYEVNGWKYYTEEEREDDNIKTWHIVQSPQGEEIVVDYNPYENEIPKNILDIWLKLGKPGRKETGGIGPLDASSIMQLAQKSGVVANIKERSMNENSTKQPDTAEGAYETLKRDADEETVADFADARWIPDPSAVGVWMGKNKRGRRVIVYMAGYPDPFGRIRSRDDFEAEEMLPESPGTSPTKREFNITVADSDYLGRQIQKVYTVSAKDAKTAKAILLNNLAKMGMPNVEVLDIEERGSMNEAPMSKARQEVDAFRKQEALKDLKALAQPISLVFPGAGGAFKYTSDINKNPDIWRASDGSTVRVSSLGEIGEYLPRWLNELWQEVLSGEETVEFLQDQGYLEAGGKELNEIFADRKASYAEGNGITADKLHVHDDVVITGDVKYQGATGVIDSFGRDKRFVVVNLYNHGKHSFHSSDVEGNDYADSDEEEEDLQIYRKQQSELDIDEQGVAEAIPYALSAANANAEYERTKTFVPRGYKGRVDTEVSGQEEYRLVMASLEKLAQEEGQHIEAGLSGTKMSIFSKTMGEQALSDFVDMALDNFDQGVAEGDVKEIDYASELGALALPESEIIKNSKVVGTIGSRKVSVFSKGDDKIYFFTDAKNTKIDALLYLMKNRLMGMKNFSQNSGLIFNLFQYLINIAGQKLEVESIDKLTHDGIKWIIKQIKRTNGFRITDQKGNKIDAAKLYSEWEQARTTGNAGPTGLIIGESKNSRYIKENEQRLMPMDIWGATAIKMSKDNAFMPDLLERQDAEENQLNELSKDTLKSYFQKRYDSIKGKTADDVKKSNKIIKKDLPTALKKLKDPQYGKQGVTESTEKSKFSKFSVNNKIWEGIGFDVRSDVLWPAKMLESADPESAEKFSAWLDDYRNSLPKAKSGKTCILAMVNRISDKIIVYYGLAKYVSEDKTHYQLKIDSGTHSYSKNNQLVFATKESFEQFKTMLAVKFGETPVDFQKMPVMETKIIATEGDVIHTKFATKQAQKARDKYQQQADVASQIPVYDPKRGKAVLPQHAQGHEEAFDHFKVEDIPYSTGNVFEIVGVTKTFKEISISTMMAPRNIVEKYVDALNRGGFSDVEIKRMPIKGYDVEESLRDPKDNPCWKGYYPVGTKKKNGRTVPNCVPKPKK